MIIPFITAILNRFKGDNTLSKGYWFLFMIPLILFASADPVVIIAWTMLLAIYAVPPTSSMLSCMMGRSQARMDSPHWQWMYRFTVIVRGFLPRTMTITETWRVSTIFYGFFRGLPCVVPVGLLYGYTDDPLTLVGLLLMLQGLPYYVFKKMLMPFPSHGDMPVVYAELTIGYFLGVYLGVL